MTPSKARGGRPTRKTIPAGSDFGLLVNRLVIGHVGLFRTNNLATALSIDTNETRRDEMELLYIKIKRRDNRMPLCK